MKHNEIGTFVEHFVVDMKTFEGILMKFEDDDEKRRKNAKNKCAHKIIAFSQYQGDFGKYRSV